MSEKIALVTSKDVISGKPMNKTIGEYYNDKVVAEMVRDISNVGGSFFPNNKSLNEELYRTCGEYSAMALRELIQISRKTRVKKIIDLEDNNVDEFAINLLIMVQETDVTSNDIPHAIRYGTKYGLYTAFRRCVLK